MQVLVFVKTRKGVDQLVDLLHQQDISADSIHGDKPQPKPACARSRASRPKPVPHPGGHRRRRAGLDIDDLPVVVNFDLPIVAEDYIHRTGRTGRA
ncbi:hypothetical protein LP420_02660 [Massilia sp. B-10]|nr:hypothetical protein LP420_02660 [Massilia sp. B-10]